MTLHVYQGNLPFLDFVLGTLERNLSSFEKVQCLEMSVVNVGFEIVVNSILLGVFSFSPFPSAPTPAVSGLAPCLCRLLIQGRELSRN